MLLDAGQGHAAHFLKRLDRLDRVHVELALTLYNDADLLREILRRARVPELAERVCLSLGDPERGPFLIVTRDGRFVTCLGEGMSPGPHPIVTRQQLDAFAAKMSDLRGRIEMSKRLTGSATPSVKLVMRALDAGMNLSREEFTALSAWTQPLRSAWLRALIGASQRVAVLLPPLQSITKVTARNEPALRELWNAIWSISHITMLLSADAREICEVLGTFPHDLEQASGRHFSVAIAKANFELGMLGATARGVYWSARCGKFVLPIWKRVHTRTAVYWDMVPAAATVAAIGLRHERLAGEVRKSINTHASDAEGWNPLANATGLDRCARDHFPHAIREMERYFRGTIGEAFDRSEAVSDHYANLGREHAFARLSSEPGASPLRFASASEVPRDIAVAVLANATFDIDGSPGLGTLMRMLPWVARAKPEDLYLPRNYLSALDYRFSATRVLDFLANQRRRTLRREPEIVPAKPGRNEHCPCESGRKYKRCCAA